MSSFVVTQEELYEIVKKRKLETIDKSEEPNQTDSKEINESLNELVIKNDTEKFIELFEKTFSKETEKIDSKDGTVQDIISKVLLKIKEKIISTEKNSTGLKLQKFLFVFSNHSPNKTKEMARTRAMQQQRPANINFESRRVAAAEEIANAWKNRINDIKIKFLLPQGENLNVKNMEML